MAKEKEETAEQRLSAADDPPGLGVLPEVKPCPPATPGPQLSAGEAQDLQGALESSVSAAQLGLSSRWQQ